MRTPWTRYGRRSVVYWDCINQSPCPRAESARKQEELEQSAMITRFNGVPI
jgi:hypothetical protein